MNEEINVKEKYSNQNLNIYNDNNNLEINNNINNNQEMINQARESINSFRNQNALDNKKDKNIEEININTNIINNEYDSNPDMKVNEQNIFNNNYYDKVSLENQNLKSQIIELMSENQNLQKLINNQDSEYSPYLTEDNNKYNYINNNQIYNPNLYSSDQFEKGMKNMVFQRYQRMEIVLAIFFQVTMQEKQVSSILT